jgi:hypothetical protein
MTPEMTPEERARKIQHHEQALEELRGGGYGASEIDPKITVCIPVGPGSMRWLWSAVFSIENLAQSEPVRLHVTTQANAPVATAAINEQAKRWRDQWRVSSFKYLGEVPAIGNKLQSICESRKVLAKSVETPWLLWLDADVYMPVGGVRIMLDWIEAHPDYGFVGIQYSQKVDHVQNGCTIMPTELAKKIGWLPVRCECYEACKQIVDLGYKVGHIPGITAIHMPEAAG